MAISTESEDLQNRVKEVTGDRARCRACPHMHGYMQAIPSQPLLHVPVHARLPQAAVPCTTTWGQTTVQPAVLSWDMHPHTQALVGGAPVTAALDPVGGKMLGELFRTLGEGGKV